MEDGGENHQVLSKMASYFHLLFDRWKANRHLSGCAIPRSLWHVL